MKRGEIYYIKRRNCFSTIGEAPKARPGVIVSADTLNANSEVVMVVYLTTHPQKSLPTHVCIHATGTPSTVLCERIDYVTTEMIGNYAGACTEKEMAAIERGMLKALDLSPVLHAEVDEEPESAEEPDWNKPLLETMLRNLQEERDRYAKMIDHLLGGADA